MRVTGLTVSGVGGLQDGHLALPSSPVTAFAGSNGTGKSKILACLLSPWSQVIPSTAPDQPAEVQVHFAVTASERASLEEASRQIGYGEASVPATFTVIRTQHPLAGLRASANPDYPILANVWTHQPFLQTLPHLNALYLPAERRLVPSGATAIDLTQLSEDARWARTIEPRSAVHNYGRLDDGEFEQFAKALCVANTLPDESGPVVGVDPRPSLAWDEFKATVDGIIAPKTLLPLSRQHPDALRIRTPSGATHPVHDLSSGERQALIVISRVARAGAGHSLVLIDEPDAYLHPHLSQRLVAALEAGVGPDGQLIVATHSPAILDSLPPGAIVRLGYDEPPRLVADEAERLDLYRGAGFRASALTQSDALVIVEGKGDTPLLTLVVPELARTAMKEAGDRARVLREVEQLSPYEIPVLGVVDRDVLAPEPEGRFADRVVVWPTADIEGVFLSDPVALDLMVTRGLVKPEFSSVSALTALLAEQVDAYKDNVLAELAQKSLRRDLDWRWPSPRGIGAIERLRATAESLRTPTQAAIDAALSEAEGIWDAHTGPDRWRLVRGKYVLNAFADRATEMRNGRSLLEAVARARPPLQHVIDFRERLQRMLHD